MATAEIDVITGALSYTGKYITRCLLARGKQVRTLTGYPNNPNPFGEQVSVHDLVVQAGQNQENIVLDAVGPDIFSYEELMRLLARVLGQRIIIGHAASALGPSSGRNGPAAGERYAVYNRRLEREQNSYGAQSSFYSSR